MTVIDLKVHHEPSPFAFDVRRCPECGWVVSTTADYRTQTLDSKCGGCQKTPLIEFELWPGKVSTSGGMNFITEE